MESQRDYKDVIVQHVSHYTTEPPPRINLICKEVVLHNSVIVNWG